MRNKLKKLILVSRPISWLNTAYPFGAGYLVSGGSLDMTFFVGILYFLVPYNLLLYGINDIFDYESDIRNPRKGGLEGAKEQKALHPSIWLGICCANIPFLMWFLVHGSFITNATLIILLFFAVAYSATYLRFKEVPILDSMTSSAHFVGPLIFSLVMTNSLVPSLPYVAAFFLWGMASHAFGAIQDITPDRKAKIASIATVLGAWRTARLTFCLYLASSFIVILQGYPGSIIGLMGICYALNTYPFLSISDETSETAHLGWQRFMWLNYMIGFMLTIILIANI